MSEKSSKEKKISKFTIIKGYFRGFSQKEAYYYIERDYSLMEALEVKKEKC